MSVCLHVCVCEYAKSVFVCMHSCMFTCVCLHVPVCLSLSECNLLVLLSRSFHNAQRFISLSLERGEEWLIFCSETYCTYFLLFSQLKLMPVCFAHKIAYSFINVYVHFLYMYMHVKPACP